MITCKGIIDDWWTCSMPVSNFLICTWPLDVTRDVPDEWSQNGGAVCPGLQWQDSGAVGQADGTGTTACGPTGGNICELSLNGILCV